MPKIRRKCKVGDVANETDRQELFDWFTRLCESGAFCGPAEVSVQFEVQRDLIRDEPEKVGGEVEEVERG